MIAEACQTCGIVFFFKQETAYEMRISDWSSDVCSSDLSIFLQLEAVALLRRPYGAPGDSAHKAKGLPTLAELMEDATALGVTFTLCQSGMDLTGLTVVDCDPAAIIGGPVSFLQSVDEGDCLLTI